LEHRIRWACENNDDGEVLTREVEVDSTYIGGKRKNMSNTKRKTLEGTGCGTVGKAIVVGIQECGDKVVAQHVK